MLKKKTKSTKPSKLPIPRRGQATPVAEATKPAKAKPGTKPAKAAKAATPAAEALDAPSHANVAPEAAQEPQAATTEAADAVTAPPPANAVPEAAQELQAVPVEATVAAAPTPAKAKPASGKLSCLDAAAEVLKAAGTPMRCREMVDAMRAKGLWSSDAPTPHQTLASALLREVTKKGPASRFRKADRGQFELNA